MVLVLTQRRLKMHSLTQLNSYSNLPIVTGDERPTSITTTPSPPTSLTSTIYSTEDVTHNMVVPFTIDTAISINATFTVNVAMYSGATVTWPTHDANLTYTNPSTGVYRVSGITGLTQWEAQNHPTVYMGPDRNGSLTYTANISGVGTTISWNNNAILAATGEINTGTLTGLYYDEDVAVTFDSGLLVTDVSPSGTYSITISKSDVTAGTLSSTGSGGTSTYSSNVLTITGTKAQVNSRLANITFTPTTGFITDFTLTYAVTNVSSSQINYATQSLLIGDTNNGIMNMHLARSYTENLDNDLFVSNIPTITETVVSSAQYTISLQLASNIGFISTSTGYLNKSGWNATTLTYTYTGTIVQCNATFADLHFYPTKNSYANAIITYTQRKNSIFQLSQTFNLTGIADATPIAGTGYITFATAGTTNWMPTYQQAYYLSCDALVVGPGGLQGSNYVYNTLRAGGGGGGAGALTVGTNINLTLLSSYQIIVGASGGAYSKFGSIVSNGGGNGGNARGSAGNAPWVYVGGSGGASATGYTGGVEQSIDYGAQLGALTTGQLLVGGSGGGGNSSIGSISYKGTRYLSPTGNLPLSGYGGHGILNSFTGTSVNYCLGAPGYPVPPFNSPPEPAIMPTTPGSGNQPGLVVIKFYE